MLKAAAGGGGKGMREVVEPSELVEAYTRAQSEGISAFGDGDIYMETCRQAKTCRSTGDGR